MVELIVVICSLLTPTACTEKHFLFEAQGSLDHCMVLAQPYLAQWMAEHQNERISQWRCAWPDQEDKRL